MAQLATIATGNWSTAGTWGIVDATSFLSSTASFDVITTAYSGTRSSAFTPGAITISHIGVLLSVRSGTTGTISVQLELDVGDTAVAGTEVTINTADLPVAATADINGGWVFFKLATPVLLLVATAYQVAVKTSTASQVSLCNNGVTDNISRALITTTTQAPVAGDDMIIAGEYTGAGTSNTFTVTGNEIATTDYGSTPTAANSLINPGLAICSKGVFTLGTTAATNYNFKFSNSIIVFSGGIMNFGTTGTPMPRDSTFTLQFDCGANVDYGLTIRNLGTWNCQGLSRTSAKNIVSCKLNTDEAANSTSLGVDTDTGWLDNDEIAVATTTQTGGQSETGTLNGAAGASTLTVDGFAGTGGGILNAHSGTSPTQAEVILLTRNIVIRGASATLQAYIDIKATTTVDADWTQFKWLGSNTTNKRGIDLGTTSSGVAFNYCCLRDGVVASSLGFNITGSTVNNITIQYNTHYNIANEFLILPATTGTAILIDNNVGGVNTGVGISGYTFTDVGNTVTNNTWFGTAGGAGMRFTEPQSTIGTISGNLVHGATNGYAFQNSLSAGEFLNNTTYRNTTAGLAFNSSPTCLGPMTIKNLIIFGCPTGVSNGSGGSFGTIWDTLTVNGDTTFACTTGLSIGGSSFSVVNKMINCDFSTVGGIKTACTSDISLGASSFTTLQLTNTKLGGTTEVLTQANMSVTSIVSSQKNDQTAGQHKSWKKYGTLQTETGTVHAPGTISLKMTPNNASNKLQSSGIFGGFKRTVANGQTCTPSIYVYEDATYNGARARLIVLRNDALGITADTVLDTATAASDAAWEELTGTTAAVTDSGTLEFIIDCDGTAGNLFVGSYSATVA